MKILVVKSELSSGPATEALSDSLLWLDELCHGLISQARFDGFFSRATEKGDLVVLRPSDSPVDCAVIYTKAGAFPWNLCEDIIPEGAKVYYFGQFTDSELKKLAEKKKWAGYSEWAID